MRGIEADELLKKNKKNLKKWEKIGNREEYGKEEAKSKKESKRRKLFLIMTGNSYDRTGELLLNEVKNDRSQTWI